MKTPESNRYPLSARSCVKRRKRAPRETRGGEDQRRRKEARATSGVIPEIAEVNFDGRLAQRRGLARRALSRAHEANRKAANEEMRGAQGRKTGQRDIRVFGGFQGDGEARWQVRVIGGDR